MEAKIIPKPFFVKKLKPCDFNKLKISFSISTTAHTNQQQQIDYDLNFKLKGLVKLALLMQCNPYSASRRMRQYLGTADIFCQFGATAHD